MVRILVSFPQGVALGYALAGLSARRDSNIAVSMGIQDLKEKLI